ncbi:replication initiator protein a [Leptolyngbya sp. Heron Island J]|nr:replication initiator protein a [Leptolyngbya sp. Heron Island J]
MVFINGDTQIRIEPGPKGIATVWDKDILIYLQTIINDRIEKGLTVQRMIRFSAYDCLKVTGRGTGKHSYDLFINALDRLRSTNIVTNITSGNQRERGGFGWIESWRIIEEEKSDGRFIMKAVEVTLNDWMFRALVNDRRVLSINEDYFSIKGGLERRLYELARKHCGRQSRWTISLEKLAEKCGTTREARKLKADILAMQKKQPLPDYTIKIDEGRRRGQKISAQTVIFAPLTPVKTVYKRANLNISEATYSEAVRLYPGYDIEFICNAWKEWAKNKQHPQKPDQAFLAFCKKYASDNPILACG